MEDLTTYNIRAIIIRSKKSQKSKVKSQKSKIFYILLLIFNFGLCPYFMHRISRQIYNQIKQSNNILLIPHKNPDGDALGSLTAFIQFLRSIDKKYSAGCATEIPDNLKVLPHSEKIIENRLEWNNAGHDLIIFFDTGDLRRAGIDEQINKMAGRPIMINFDHHAANELYGDYNMVAPELSSTTEVLYNFFRHNNINIDACMSTCLLTGLISDTDFFTNSSASISSLNIASRLIAAGGNSRAIKELMFMDKSIDALKLWGLALSRLKKHQQIDIVYTYLTLEDLIKYNVSEAASEGVANFMNNINEGKMNLILKEMPDNKIKGSFRTTRNDVDAAAIAKQLGGGGHQKAAGFTIDGPLKEAARKVFEVIKTYPAIGRDPAGERDKQLTISN